MCLAVPARVAELLDPGERLASVELAGVRRTVSTALLDGEPEVGEWVLVHVGFALARIDEAEAEATLALLAQAAAAGP